MEASVIYKSLSTSMRCINKRLLNEKTKIQGLLSNNLTGIPDESSCFEGKTVIGDNIVYSCNIDKYHNMNVTVHGKLIFPSSNIKLFIEFSNCNGVATLLNWNFVGFVNNGDKLKINLIDNNLTIILSSSNSNQNWIFKCKSYTRSTCDPDICVL